MVEIHVSNCKFHAVLDKVPGWTYKEDNFMLRRIRRIASHHKDFLDFDLSRPDSWSRVAELLNAFIDKKQLGAKKTGEQVRKRLEAIRKIMRNKQKYAIPADWRSLEAAQKLFDEKFNNTKFTIPKLVPARPSTSMATSSTNFTSFSHFPHVPHVPRVPAVDPSIMGQWVDDMALLSAVAQICKDLQLKWEEEHLICNRATKRELMHLVVTTQGRSVAEKGEVVARLLSNLKQREIS